MAIRCTRKEHEKKIEMMKRLIEKSREMLESRKDLSERAIFNLREGLIRWDAELKALKAAR